MSRPEADLWDFAGVDGLELACEVFGPEAHKLSVYHSLEISLLGAEGSLLRLGENNFRLSHPDASGTLTTAAAGKRVWVKQSTLTHLTLGVDALDRLLKISIVKPPHRLAGLPNDRAVPVRIDGSAALVWHHHGIFEVQTAQRCAENSISPLPLSALLALAEPH